MLSKQEVAAMVQQKFSQMVELLPDTDCEYRVMSLQALLPKIGRAHV